MDIQVRNVSKRFGTFEALRNVDLTVRSGELVALLGPSGSGKSTLLRIIAGLETADEGSIRLGQQDVQQLRLRERRIGFVFQHYALFRHMSVFDNVAFGLRVRPRKVRPSSREIRRRVMSLLELIKLEAMADRLPSQLSGGQRQRVGLARALAVEPRVLLLDEPFGALDAKVRKELRRWLRNLHDKIHITSLFVTHDQDEALELGNRVVVMNQGRIEQVGTPQEVYDHPVSPFVCDFLGDINRFHGAIRNGRAQLGVLEVDAPAHAPAGVDVPAVGYVRPHDLAVSRQRESAGDVQAVVRHIAGVGPWVRLELMAGQDDHPLEVHLSKAALSELDLRIGDSVFVKTSNLRVFVEPRA